MNNDARNRQAEGRRNEDLPWLNAPVDKAPECDKDGILKHAYHMIYRHGLAVDGSSERLAMGSTTGGLWSSLDGGESWHTVTTDLPPIYFVHNRV